MKKETLPGNFYAAIDMGTNSFHLIIVEVKEDGSFKIVDREREVIRLASQKGKNLNIITDDEIDRAIIILNSFRKLAEFYKAKMHAVATSAVREAENGKEFVKKVYETTGIKVEIIEGQKEAELIYLGAKKALKLKDTKSLCIDIGGGSSEFIYAENSKIVFARSIKIGAVRLSKKFFPGYLLNNDLVRECEQYAESEILSDKKIQFNADFAIAAGTSGTIQSIARMIYYKKYNEFPKSLNGTSFSREELDSVYSLLINTKSVEERLLLRGIEEKRADILPAGLIILRKVFDLFNIDRMTISEYALREGIVIDIMRTT
ncbi:MAG: Ppx/GppA phosphatase family protein [Ignavibacteriaceae bacterium]